MVAAGSGDDARLRNFSREQIGKRAARLERSRVLQLFELQGDRERVEAEIGGIELDQGRAADERPNERLDLGDACAADRLLGYLLGRRQRSAHSAAAAGRPPIQCSRSPRARALRACFLARVFAVPARRMASASGGNRPKLTFIGWN